MMLKISFDPGWIDEGKPILGGSFVTADNKAQSIQMNKPDLALKRLDILVGKWRMKGRTSDALKDNMSGELVAEWMLGGSFLRLTSWIRSEDQVVRSEEIVGHDPIKKMFTSIVFSDLRSAPIPYEWDIHGNTVKHSGAGATYQGTVSDDGNTITGRWSPDSRHGRK